MKNYFKNKKIGVIYGGTSSEREISLKSGRAVFGALKKLKFNACLIDAKTSVIEKIKKTKIDFAYIALHGPGGEDGKIQGVLDILNIPYTGCGVLSSALSMDKIMSKKLFKCAGVATPQWYVLKKEDNKDAFQKTILKSGKCHPVVVKPASQGSAIGISIVNKKEELKGAFERAFKCEDTILIERYIKGAEITVGVLGGEALPVIDIVPKNKFYDYEAKYAKGGSKHIIPSRLPKGVQKKARQIAEKIYSLFNCRALCRIDMIADAKGKLWVLEINTVPGMTGTSLFPEAAKAVDLNFENLVLKIMELSLNGK
jgi:D-alanine-D-alanine ligase